MNSVNTIASSPSEPAIIRELRDLAAGVDDLREELQTLGLRIGPIMIPGCAEPPPDNQACPDPDSIRSNIAMQINDQTCSIANMLGTVKDMLKRSQL